MYVKLKWLRKPKTTAVPIPERAWKEISFNRLIFNTTRCSVHQFVDLNIPSKSWKVFYVVFPPIHKFFMRHKVGFFDLTLCLMKNSKSVVPCGDFHFRPPGGFSLHSHDPIPYFCTVFFSTFSSPSKDSIGAILPFLKSNKTSERGSFLLT